MHLHFHAVVLLLPLLHAAALFHAAITVVLPPAGLQCEGSSLVSTRYYNEFPLTDVRTLGSQCCGVAQHYVVHTQHLHCGLGQGQAPVGTQASLHRAFS